MAKEESLDRGYVQYVGASGRRGLTLEDMESVGITGQENALWWTRENGWKVPRADIPDAVYEVAIKSDPEMILVDGDSDETVKAENVNRKPLAAEMTPMPAPPENPGDYVGGGSLTGTSGRTGGGTEGATGTRGTTGARGARGGSATGSTGT